MAPKATTRHVNTKFCTLAPKARTRHVNTQKNHMAPWVFTVLYIQRIQIFKHIHTIYTTNVHTFPLNFHYFILSMKSNFSTSLDYLYILCTPSQFGTFIDFPSIFPEFLHSTNSNFFTNSNYSRHLPLGDLYESFIFPSWSLSIFHIVTYLKKKNTKTI